MTCQEFKEQVGAWALGALEPGEAAACEAHLAQAAAHEGCVEELDRARAAADALVRALPPARPSKAVWEGIEARIGVAARPRRRVGLAVVAALGWVAAAAALILLFLRPPRREAGDLEALLGLPGTRIVALAPQGDAPQRAVAVVNSAAKKAVVVGTGLVPQAGRDYELWVIRGDRKLAAGLLRAGEDGAMSVEVDPRLLEGGVDAFAVTLEPAGGGEQPRGPILLVGTLG